MKIRHLVLELYGERGIDMMRHDYRHYLNRNYNDLTEVEKMGLAYGLRLHGTTGDILWAWEAHMKAKQALRGSLEAAERTKSVQAGWESLR